MADDIEFTHTTVYFDDDTSLPPWHLTGDLRAPDTGFDDDANYECRDALRDGFPAVAFDPESSCFYAYAPTEAEARRLAEAIDIWVAARRGAPLTVVVDSTSQPDERNLVLTSAQLDSLYDTVAALSQRLGTSAHERDAKAFLHDAMSALSRASDALAKAGRE